MFANKPYAPWNRALALTATLWVVGCDPSDFIPPVVDTAVTDTDDTTITRINDDLGSIVVAAYEPYVVDPSPRTQARAMFVENNRGIVNLAACFGLQDVGCATDWPDSDGEVVPLDEFQDIDLLADLVGRRQILAVHAKKVKLAEDVDLEKVARGTPMFSGADLAALINEAAIIATMADKDFVELADLEEARDKVRWGRANKSRKIEQQERVATAYHEAGHAVLQVLLEHADPLHKVTIIPRGQAMGATFSLPEKDRYGFGRKHVLATLRVLCGGRIAEERKTGDTSSGASMDIKMCTQYSRAMILQWGMSDRLGFVNYAGSDSREMFVPERDYSPETARIIDEETRRIIDEAYTQAQQMLTDHWDKVVAVAEALLKYETLQRDDVDRLMRGESMGKPTVADLLAGEAARSKPVIDGKHTAEPGADSGLGGVVPSPA
jgi:cell division protease FtsH